MAYVTRTIIIIVLTIMSEAFQSIAKHHHTYLNDYHVVSYFEMHFELMMVASVYLECEAKGGVSIMITMISCHIHTLLSKQ